MRLPSVQGKRVRGRTLHHIQEHLASLKNGTMTQDETGWYRGLSESQLEAAQSMGDCVRDDLNKKVAYRVSKLLERLGLHPTPPCDTLLLVMRLSRGSDLAFLWFLMEMCYKSPNHGRSYSVNEQIIMSSIFWLDLFPTLRELDRWLPLPHAAQSDRDRAEAIRHRRQRLKREREEEHQKELARRAKQQRPLAPYFQEPNLGQRMRNNHRLLSDYPDRPAHLFGMQDPQPRVSPMWSRWFGNYTLSEAHRVARSIVNEEINSIFQSFQAASLPPDKVESLCAHHQHIREMEKSLKIELDLLKQRKCEELIMAKNRAEERRQKLVVQELEEMSAAYLKRFREMAARARLASTRRQLFGGGSSSATGYPFIAPDAYKCDEMEDDRCPYMEAIKTAPITLQLRRRSQSRRSASRSSRARSKGGAEPNLKSRSRKRSKSKSRSKFKSRSKSRSKSHKKQQRISLKKPLPPVEQPRPKIKPDFRDIMVKLLKGDRPIVPNCPDFQLEPPTCAQCHIYDPEVDRLESRSRSLKHRPSSLMQFLKQCGSAEDEKRDRDPKSDPDSSSHPGHDRRQSEANFMKLGPPGSNTVKFNYRELFGSMHRTRLDDEQMLLKEAFVRAIDDDVQYLSAAMSGEEEGSIDALVDRAAKRVFAEDVKAFHKELRRLQRRRAAEKNGQHERRLDFGQEFYDAKNLPLMQEMLRLGLEQVAKDKRYVLPTLPNVHSVPYLIEWICLRYGKRYSQREREQSFHESKEIIDKIVRYMRTSLVRIPPVDAVGSLRDHVKLQRVARCHRERYTKRFLDSIMGVSRAFYSALRPQLCSAGMTGTFYAYMPAHYNDMGFSLHRKVFLSS